MSGSMNVTFSRRRYVSVFLAVSEVYLQQMVYQRRRFTTINQLKQAINTKWGKLSQRFTDHTIGQWRRRVAGISALSSKADTLNS